MNRLNGRIESNGHNDTFILNGLTKESAIRLEKKEKRSFFYNIFYKLSVLIRTKITKNWIMVDLNTKNGKTKTLLKVGDIRKKLLIHSPIAISKSIDPIEMNQAANYMYVSERISDLEIDDDDFKNILLFMLMNYQHGLLKRLRDINASSTEILTILEDIPDAHPLYATDHLLNASKLLVKRIETKRKNENTPTM